MLVRSILLHSCIFSWPILTISGERKSVISCISGLTNGGILTILTKYTILNIPGVPRAALQTPLWFINKVTDWSFVKISLTNLHYQTLRARELKFWEKVTSPHMSHVTCHMSHVTCHMSHVTHHVSHVNFFFFFFLQRLKLFSGGSVISGAYPSSYYYMLLFLCPNIFVYSFGHFTTLLIYSIIHSVMSLVS